MESGLRVVAPAGLDSVSVRLADVALRYREPLTRYFMRRGLRPEAAEDCVQDVFLRLSRAGDAIVDNAEAYLFTIASSVMMDHLRRARSRLESRHDPIEAVDLPYAQAGPAQIFEDRESLRRLASALDELPQRTREIFLLNRLDRLSYTQLSVRFEISISAIEKHMIRALAHIRKRAPRDA